MKKLFKCSVCNLVCEGETAPDVCPKCGAPKEKFAELSQESADKIYKSERTNDIHMQIISLADQIIALAQEGIKIDLDPPCVAGFKKAINESYVMKQIAKAEIENHVGKGKW